MFTKFCLLFHTLRYLRAQQVLARLWIRVPRGIPEAANLPLRESAMTWQRPAGRVRSMHSVEQFTFLGETREVSGRHAWNDPVVAKLWLYNLHYFDDLNADGAEERVDMHRRLFDRWIAENPPVAGNGWEPYPVSLRVVNWIKWALRGNATDAAWQASLAQQVRWLRKRLEYHLLGNHLFANAKALVFAGLFFAGDEAGAWLEKGLALLRAQLAEQFLADGGHFELSPMYHAILLEDVLDLLQLARLYPGVLDDRDLAVLRAIAQHGMTWLETMTHPDGQLALFNDSALNIALPGVSLRQYAQVLGLEWEPRQDSQYLADSGYLRLANQDACLLLDVARVGPDYLPGHAHADTLSFELSLGGARLFVNTGTSLYGVGEKRLYQRSTAAHNTLVVDGQDSSEVWGGFRVARRAYPLELQFELGEGWASCAHDGYRRLPGRVTHHRSWYLRERELEIVDVLTGSYHSAVACFHLHPDVVVTSEGETLELTLAGVGVTFAVEGGILSVSEDTWCPGFGDELPSRQIRVNQQADRLTTRIAWHAADRGES